MTTLHPFRRFIAWILFPGTVVAVVDTACYFHGSAPSWSLALMFPIYAALAYLGYLFIANPPCVAIGADFFEIRTYPWRPLRIPLVSIKEAYMRRPFGYDGRARLLEIRLHAHTPETSSYMESWAMRGTLRELSRFDGFAPPAGAYILVSLPLLRQRDTEVQQLLDDRIPRAKTYKVY